MPYPVKSLVLRILFNLLAIFSLTFSQVPASAQAAISQIPAVMAQSHPIARPISELPNLDATQLPSPETNPTSTFSSSQTPIPEPTQASTQSTQTPTPVPTQEATQTPAQASPTIQAIPTKSAPLTQQRANDLPSGCSYQYCLFFPVIINQYPPTTQPCIMKRKG